MKLPRLLNSPLAATAGVLVGLALLAIPLHQLTSSPPTPKVEVATPTPQAGTPAWLTLKLLAPATTVSLSTPTGDSLWTAQNLPAGDHETRIQLPITEGMLELVIEIESTSERSETAAFLSIAPDGLSKQTRHSIGSGRLLELMNFNWQNP